MKKYVAILVVIALCCSSGLAERCPQPKPNTEMNISFSEFEWYSDYGSAMRIASELGYSNSSALFSRNRGCVTPHWNTYEEIVHCFAGSETNCGGELIFYAGPKVAGYDLYELDLRFIYTPNIGRCENYEEEGAVQLYMVEYIFISEHEETVYWDLVEKLESIYGDKPYDNRNKSDNDILCSYWINEDGATVGVKCEPGWYVSVIYSAPGSEDALAATEKWVQTLEMQYAREQVSEAAGDTSGL